VGAADTPGAGLGSLLEDGADDILGVVLGWELGPGETSPLGDSLSAADGAGDRLGRRDGESLGGVLSRSSDESRSEDGADEGIAVRSASSQQRSLALTCKAEHIL